jgi:hypothetical protein
MAMNKTIEVQGTLITIQDNEGHTYITNIYAKSQKRRLFYF